MHVRYLLLYFLGPIPEELKDSLAFKNAFAVPEFRTKKKKNPQECPPCVVREDLLQALQKKEDEKK